MGDFCILCNKSLFWCTEVGLVFWTINSEHTDLTCWKFAAIDGWSAMHLRLIPVEFHCCGPAVAGCCWDRDTCCCTCIIYHCMCAAPRWYWLACDHQSSTKLLRWWRWCYFIAPTLLVGTVHCRSSTDYDVWVLSTGTGNALSRPSSCYLWLEYSGNQARVQS